MSTSQCGGYHYSQGQYVVSSCNPESSTFFIVLGFTMLVLMLLLFIVVVIACIRKKRLRRRSRPRHSSSSQDNEDDCVIDLPGMGQSGDDANGRNLENVKAVIMAGEDKVTYIAHPISPSASSSGGLHDEDLDEVYLDDSIFHEPSSPSAAGESPTHEVREELSRDFGVAS